MLVSLASEETSAELFDVSIEGQAEANNEPSFFERLYPVRIFTILAGGNTGGSKFYEKIAQGTGGKVYYTNSSDEITKALFDITGKITDGSSGTPTAKTPENSPVVAFIIAGAWMTRMFIFQRKKGRVRAEA